ADLRHERRELLERALARIIAQPFELLETVFQGGAQIRDQRFHLRFRLRREMLLDVHPPDQLADAIVRVADRTLPAVALHFWTAQHLPVERELRVVEALRQIARMIAEIVEGKIRPQRFERRGPKEPRRIANRRGLPNHEALACRNLERIEERLPLEA